MRSVSRPHRISARAGMTLVELLIFLGLLGIVVGVIFPIIFTAVENRLLQQTIAVVEQNGVQLLQTMGQKVRGAERVLDPPVGSTGSVLALQTGSGTSTPTIIAVQSGSLVLIRYATQRTLSSSEVYIDNFVARNTSVSGSRQSVFVSFDISRTIRLEAPRTYDEHFEAVFTLMPDDLLFQTGCSCITPYCQAEDSYLWQVCNVGHCDYAVASLECVPR